MSGYNNNHFIGGDCVLENHHLIYLRLFKIIVFAKYKEQPPILPKIGRTVSNFLLDFLAFAFLYSNQGIVYLIQLDNSLDFRTPQPNQTLPPILSSLEFSKDVHGIKPSDYCGNLDESHLSVVMSVEKSVGTVMRPGWCWGGLEGSEAVSEAVRTVSHRPPCSRACSSDLTQTSVSPQSVLSSLQPGENSPLTWPHLTSPSLPTNFY